MFSPGLPYQQAIGSTKLLPGPAIVDIEPASPLVASLRSGDILVSLAGKELVGRHEEDLPELRALISELKPGSEIEFSAFRPSDGSTVAGKVEVGLQSPATGPNAECKKWGLTVRGITRELVKDYGLSNQFGVIVTGRREGGPAQVAKIEAGYVIRSIDGVPVTDFQQFMELYGKHEGSSELLLTTTAGKFTMMHLLRPDVASEPQAHEEATE
jgi:S1-C subfamily serine protease